MPTRSSKLDLSQLAKRIVDEARGNEPKTEPPPEKNEAAVALDKLGGKKGGAGRSIMAWLTQSLIFCYHAIYGPTDKS